MARARIAQLAAFYRPLHDWRPGRGKSVRRPVRRVYAARSSALAPDHRLLRVIHLHFLSRTPTPHGFLRFRDHARPPLAVDRRPAVEPLDLHRIEYRIAAPERDDIQPLLHDIHGDIDGLGAPLDRLRNRSTTLTVQDSPRHGVRPPDHHNPVFAEGGITQVKDSPEILERR